MNAVRKLSPTHALSAAPHADQSAPRNGAHTDPAFASDAAFGQCGVVQSILPGAIISVRLDSDDVVRCMRAASCLLQPAEGDVVLVAGPSQARRYVIAVIEQVDSSKTELCVSGHLSIRADGGAVAIHGRDAVRLESAGAVEMRADAMKLSAMRADCQVDELHYGGGAARFAVQSIAVVGRSLEVMMDRIMQVSRTVFRVTEEVEQTRAKVIDSQASETLRLHGKNTILSASKVVKADGKQIHIG